MWRREDVLRELKEEGLLELELGKNENSGGLPPGFRFHPTDEELITFYLASKVFKTTTTTTTATTTRNHLLSDSGAQIVEVDLTRCEPWDLPERAKMGEREWYLYSLRDRKYPSGLRTNRATETGYWKATGKDRQVYATGITTAAGGAGGVLIGMKKTLVFYQGRAPRGVKTRWVMHEYRLDGHFSSFRLSSKEEWVICRVFHKNGEKKNPPIINAPPLSPPLSPPALSPFLSCLPPLQEPPATTQVAADTQRSLHNANYDLLHALLSSPLPNFSSISGSDTIFPPTNATLQTTATPNAAALASMSASSTLSKTFHHPFPQPKHLPSFSSATLNCQQHPHHWLDKICPQVNNQHQYHHHHNSLNYDMMDPLPNNYTIAPHDGNDDGDDEVTAVHHADMSPSLAVAALDRMLNDNINHPPAQSWTFHP